MEVENLTLTKHPFRTLNFFMLAMLQYLKRLGTYILSKGALFVLLIVLVVAPGLFLAVLMVCRKRCVTLHAIGYFITFVVFMLIRVSMAIRTHS